MSMIRAKHTSGIEREVPEHWTGEKSPFPGQWTPVKEDRVPEPQTAEPSVAGDATPTSPETTPAKNRSRAGKD